MNRNICSYFIDNWLFGFPHQRLFSRSIYHYVQREVYYRHIVIYRYLLILGFNICLYTSLCSLGMRTHLFNMNVLFWFCCVCVCVCARARACVCVHTYIHMYIYTSSRARTYTCTHTHAHPPYTKVHRSVCLSVCLPISLTIVSAASTLLIEINIKSINLSSLWEINYYILLRPFVI